MTCCIYAADLARSPDGHWWVLGDRTQAPSGAGYALENRIIISRVFPQVFRELHGAAPRPVLRRAARHAAALGAARRRRDAAHRAADAGPVQRDLLRACLPRALSRLPLVEGSDLTVRDDRVCLKTLTGCERVHAILRRLDDDYCDPLELRTDSALGVAGPVEARARGNVLVANALGSGLLESRRAARLPADLARRLLGEQLQLPSLATWWCGEPAAWESVAASRQQVVKPRRALPGERPFDGEDLPTPSARGAAARIERNPKPTSRRSRCRVAGAGLEQNGARSRARRLGCASSRSPTPGGSRDARRADARRRRRDARVSRCSAAAARRHLGAADGPVDTFSMLPATLRRRATWRRRRHSVARGREPVLVRPLRRALRRLRRGCCASRSARCSTDEERDSRPVLAPLARWPRRLGLVERRRPWRSRAAARRRRIPKLGLGQRAARSSSASLSTCATACRSTTGAPLNRLIADPVFAASAALPMDARSGSTARSRALMTLSGFVARRHDARRRLALPFDRPSLERLATLRRAAGCATDEGRLHGSTGCSSWPTRSVTYRARYLARRSGCRCSTC